MGRATPPPRRLSPSIWSASSARPCGPCPPGPSDGPCLASWAVRPRCSSRAGRAGSAGKTRRASSVRSPDDHSDPRDDGWHCADARRGERLAMTNESRPKPSRLRQLFSESTLYTAGNVVRRSFSLITMPVFTRYLSPSGYGVLSIVGTVQNMLEVFYELGMGQSSTRFYYECRDARERQTLFGTLLILSLAVTAILSVILLLVGQWLWGLIAPEVPFYPYIGLTIATVFFGTIRVLPRAIVRVENQVPRFFRLSVSQTALTAILAVVLVVGFAVGPVGPIVATTVVAFIYFAVYAVALRGHVRFAFDWDLARRALGFGLPEIPVRWGSWALKVSDRLILQHFTTLSAVGLYSVGASIGKMPFDLVANGIHWAIVPFFYATATQESEARS